MKKGENVVNSSHYILPAAPNGSACTSLGQQNNLTLTPPFPPELSISKRMSTGINALLNLNILWSHFLVNHA